MIRVVINSGGDLYMMPAEEMQGIFHINNREGECDIREEVKGLFLIENTLAEIDLRIEQDKLLGLFEEMNTEQRTEVIEFALAVREGKSSVRALAHRVLEAERVANWRNKMQPEEMADYQAKQAERSRNWRNKMSLEEAAEYRAKQAERARIRRTQMSPEEAAELRAKDVARKRLARGSPSPG